MYHAVIRAIVKNLFRALNKGDYEPILAGFAPEFEHWFVGTHALSGLRTSMPTTRAWYERLLKIFPNIKFDIRNIVVSGWPWNTLVAVEWTDSYTLLNGEKRTNCGVHMIRLVWGKGVSVHIYCDTELLLENLAIQKVGGIGEASYAPLID
jgi:ketosteroid isomerase-like protein